MADDGWVRRDPKTGEYPKKSWLDEVFSCLSVFVLGLLGFGGLLAGIAVILKAAAS